MASKITYSILKAAKFLGVHRTRVDQFLADGRLNIEPPEEHGDNLVIAHGELVRFKRIQRKPGRPRTKSA